MNSYPANNRCVACLKMIKNPNPKKTFITDLLKVIKKREKKGTA